MEGVLDVYERPYDPFFPVVCLDEASTQLVGEVRDPLPAIPGSAATQDAEYVRNGTASLLMATGPMDEWRHVKVPDHRTQTDFATFVHELVDSRFKYAASVVPVIDNLNTHAVASLYEAFTPAEACESQPVYTTPVHRRHQPARTPMADDAADLPDQQRV